MIPDKEHPWRGRIDGDSGNISRESLPQYEYCPKHDVYYGADKGDNCQACTRETSN